MLPKNSAPGTFYLQELLSDRPIIVIQFEYAGRDRTSPGEAGSGRPSQPVVNQRFEAGQPLFCIHGRSDNMLCRNLPDVLQKSKLHLLFRSKMGKESALRHARLFSEDSNRDAGQTGSAQEIGALIKDARAGRVCFCHNYK